MNHYQSEAPNSSWWTGRKNTVDPVYVYHKTFMSALDVWKLDLLHQQVVTLWTITARLA